jgi:outer membrane protein assembly factor BamA
MANLNINGRTVDPTSVRKISVPEGETPASYVQKNEAVIRKNFKDELYFESNGELFVTEDKFVIENSGLSRPSDARIRHGAVPAIPLLIDNEPDALKVTQIEVQGVSGPDADWAKKQLKFRVGERVNLHDLQRRADDLFKSDKFLSVDFIPKASADGIDLALKVVPVPTKVAFHGIPAAEQEALRKLFPQPLTQAHITQGMEALQKAHDANPQHLLAGLDFQIQGDTLQVMASRVQTPQNLHFDGAMAQNEAQQAKQFFSQPYNYENIQQGMEKLKGHYAKQGYVLPNLEFNVNGDNITVQMTKAPMPTRTEFKGMTVYKPEEVKALFGEPMTMDNIQKGLEALQKKYADAGYLLMPPEGVSADLDKGVLTINVREAKLGDVILSGNDKTKAAVIQRELRQKANQPVNMHTLDEDLKRVAGTGLFANVQKTVEPDPDNPDKVRVRVHTAEDKASSFSVGAGYSMGNGPFGTASLNMGNVGGQNRRVSIDGTLGMKVWGGGVSYYDPWAFANRTSLGASVYHRQWQGPYSDETRTGAKVTLGRPLGDIYTSPWRADITIDAQRVGIDKQYSASGTGVDYRLGIRPSLTYNTLDDPMLPREGTRMNVYAEPVLGSATLGKFGGEVNHHIPMGERFSFSAGLQGGTVIGNAPLYEKFNNAGSGRTLLGWDSDGAQVGSSYAIASAGVNAQIWGPVSATAKLTAGDFFDGTQVDPKVGAGVGVNVKVGNLGVLHAGYGMKLVGKEKGESSGAFHLGFGIPF